MLAEMGDRTFEIGDLAKDNFESVFTNEKLLDPLEQSISISALSIPFPNSAPIKCSIVDTLAPYSFEIVVQSVALLTLNILGII